MPRFDLTLEELREYRPAIHRPDDFDEFWRSTLAEAGAAASETIGLPHPSPFTAIDVTDITFSGYGGQPVKAWLLSPAGIDADEPLPCIVQYVGYGMGRGYPNEHVAWVAAGNRVFVMDTRGQGSGWGSGGETGDDAPTGPSAPGFVTRGIESPETYYYRRVFTDAARAVDVVRAMAGVDSSRVVAAGASQGGGIALAVAGLVDGLAAVLSDVPFLCHFSRAVGMTGAEPYNEVVRYLSVHRNRDEQTFETLSYFDGVNFAARATAPAMFSVGLMDQVCPPSTVFAAFNAYGGPKSIEVYPFDEHVGGGPLQWWKQAHWLPEHLARKV